MLMKIFQNIQMTITNCYITNIFFDYVSILM